MLNVKHLSSQKLCDVFSSAARFCTIHALLVDNLFNRAKFAAEFS